MMNRLPILYSFRRCPYAMRARIGLLSSGITVELREVALNNKPAQMLEVSAKGTVPVLMLNNGDVIDESFDILLWALQQNDPRGLLVSTQLAEAKKLIEANDTDFKDKLDAYKYSSRYPETPVESLRLECENFLSELDRRLQYSDFLIGRRETIADIAIFPFIRQFSLVDSNYFQNCRFSHLRRWLQHHLCSNIFETTMQKYPFWLPQKLSRLFPE